MVTSVFAVEPNLSTNASGLRPTLILRALLTVKNCDLGHSVDILIDDDASHIKQFSNARDRKKVSWLVDHSGSEQGVA